MKKIKHIIGVLLLMGIFSAGFAFTPHRIDPVDIRADGMGGSYFTDSESFYTLFSNPAGLAFAGEKTLWPPIISMGLGGPLEEIKDLGMNLIKGDEDNQDGMVDDLLGMLGDAGLNLNVRIGGPLTFGAIRNNFGWGFVNAISVDARVPSITKSDIKALFDLGLVFGYAVPIDLGFLGKLSIGFSARGIAQAQASYTEGVTALMDFDVAKLPLSTTFGVGFDMGVQYRLLNLVDVAVVWRDVYTATWTQTHNVESFNFGGSTEYEKLESKLGVGVGFDIPIERITANIISHLGVHLNYNDLWPLFNAKKEPVYRNPALELSVGAELVLFDVIALRVGINEMYPAAGLGIYIGGFRIDFSIYGRELGLEPGYTPQLNMGLSMTIQY